MQSADTPLNGEDFETIRQLEESLWRAETRFDNALMNRVFADDFFEFGRSGKIYARSEMFSEPGACSPIRATLPLPDFRARHLSVDVVHVTYISEVISGGEVLRGNRSSIWSRTPTGWILRFHQGTPL